MRYAFLALLFVAGCGDSIRPDSEWPEEAGNEGTTVNIDPALLNNPTSELGTDRTRGIAKTIEWLPISTEDGATYGDDSIVVDRILRDDADNNYGVRIRLKNTVKDVRKIQWLVRFYTRQGSQIAGYYCGAGNGEKWQGAVLDPFGYTVISDFARVMGADGFRLLIKTAGSAGDGSPDDPATKQERKEKREAGKTAK
ncbi:MAG TPA: hypothetical protein VE981_08555 [Planctomycetota bacterium]|nr:hypothetical protein [Planctomycetota bacterium]